MKKLLFGLDYDGTYTACPDLFLMIVRRIKMEGHNVYLITMRSEDELEDVDYRILELVDRVIPTTRKAKRKFIEALGIHVDIWFDDNPYWVENDAF